MEKIEQDYLVIGAGVVGLAVAARLSSLGKNVIVIESNKAIGEETSSRNSEVIHAGIYYPEDSLKKELCIEGKKLLYDYCDDKKIDYQKCGKLIVANTDEQLSYLEDLYKKVNCADVPLQLLTSDEVAKIEPELNCKGAILSESTGIIDSHNLMLSLQAELENNGGKVAFRNKFDSAEITEEGIKVRIEGNTTTEILTKNLINCAGLSAVEIANKISGLKPIKYKKTYYAKGNYFSLAGKAPFKHLIYPVPEKDGLGVHLTLDLSGRARFGPDVEWVDEKNYAVNSEREENFYKSIRNYWPDLPNDSLQPSYSGIRPKLYPQNDKTYQDFVIEGPEENATNGVVNLFGIESPGLTASLAIARKVSDILG